MHGTITFTEVTSLAEFLAAFTGKSTATFEVEEKPNGTYVLTFAGGY